MGADKICPPFRGLFYFKSGIALPFNIIYDRQLFLITNRAYKKRGEGANKKTLENYGFSLHLSQPNDVDRTLLEKFASKCKGRRPICGGVRLFHHALPLITLHMFILYAKEFKFFNVLYGSYIYCIIMVTQ